MNSRQQRHLNRFSACLAALLLFARSEDLAAQRFPRDAVALSESFYRSGELTVASFAPIVMAIRPSVIQVLLDGQPVALGAIVDADGLAITKASELRSGKLTAKLSDGRTVDFTPVATDSSNDVAMVKLKATGLKPIIWSETPVSLGQWLVTPGLRSTPEAIGVLSTPNRKMHKRAIIGVLLDQEAPNARIQSVQPGFGASRAGIRSGDVILTVNGTAVKDNEELRSALSDFREGVIVELRLERDGEELNVSVEMKSDAGMVAAAPTRGSGRANRQSRFAGEVSQRSEDFEMAMQHDAVLQPDQCGGPLLALDGKVIGLNIARAGRVASYALPASLVKRIVENLKEAGGLEPVKAEQKSGN